MSDYNDRNKRYIVDGIRNDERIVRELFHAGKIKIVKQELEPNGSDLKTYVKIKGMKIVLTDQFPVEPV